MGPNVPGACGRSPQGETHGWDSWARCWLGRSATLAWPQCEHLGTPSCPAAQRTPLLTHTTSCTPVFTGTLAARQTASARLSPLPHPPTHMHTPTHTHHPHKYTPPQPRPHPRTLLFYLHKYSGSQADRLCSLNPPSPHHPPHFTPHPALPPLMPGTLAGRRTARRRPTAPRRQRQLLQRLARRARQQQRRQQSRAAARRRPTAAKVGSLVGEGSWTMSGVGHQLNACLRC